MSRGRHASDRGTFPRDLIITLVGIVVVAVLVFGGLWLFSAFFGNGDDSAASTNTVADEASTSTRVTESSVGTPSTTAVTSTPDDSTPPTITVRSPSEITVQVLNGIGVTGLASEVSATLEAEGYRTVEPDDYEPLLEQSQVLFKDGFGPEAFELAALFPDAQVGMSPDVPDNVDIVVVLGSSYEGE